MNIADNEVYTIIALLLKSLFSVNRLKRFESVFKIDEDEQQQDG